MATKTRASGRGIKIEAAWILREPNGKQIVRNLLAAERGDTVAQSNLDSALIENPRLWKIIDTVENELAGGLIKSCFPESWLLQKAMSHRMETMREELLGDSPSPVDRLLVERICVCWLGLQSAQLKSLGNAGGERSIATLDFYDRQLGAANKRYLAAIRALASIRRLQLPSFGQLNIGAHQLNVAAQLQEPSAQICAETTTRQRVTTKSPEPGEKSRKRCEKGDPTPR